MHVQEKVSLWRRVGQLLGLVRPQPTKPIRNELVTNTRQDYKEQVAQRIKRLEQVINAANGNGNGQGDNGNGQGNGDQQGINDRSRARLIGASKAAVKATLFTEHPTSSKWALQALEAQRQGNAGEAWDAHRKAAMGHDMKAEELRDTAERQSKKLKPDYSPDEQTGLLEDAQAEQDAADAHRRAMTKSASAHLANNRATTIPTDLDFTWPSLEAVFNAEKKADAEVAKRAKKAARIAAGDEAGDEDDYDQEDINDDASAATDGDQWSNVSSFEERRGSGSLQSGQPLTDDDLNFGPPPTKTPKEMLEEAGLTLPDNKPSQWWSEDMADSNFALSQDNFQKLGLLTRQPQPQGMGRTSLSAGQVQNCGTPSHLIVNNDRWATMTMSQQQAALLKGYVPAHMVFNQNGWNLVANAVVPTANDGSGGMDTGFEWPSLFDAGCPTVNHIGAVPVTNQAQGQARFPEATVQAIRLQYGEAGVRALGASGPTPVVNYGQGPVMVDAGPQVEGCMEGLAREGAESRRRHRQFYGF